MFRSLLKIWPLISPYKARILLGLFLGFLLAICSILLPASIKVLIDALEQKPLDLSQLASYAQYFGLELPESFQMNDHFLIVKSVAIFLPIYYFTVGFLRFSHFFIIKSIGERIINDMRIQVMSRFLKLNPTFFMNQETASGGLLSKTINDSMIIQQSIELYTNLVREPITTIVIVSYLFYLNWKITLFCFFFLPIFSIVIRKITKVLTFLHTHGQQSLDRVVLNLKESLDGMRVIQSYNLEQEMQKNFRQRIDEYYSLRKKIIKRSELTSPLNEFFVSLFLATIVIWVAGFIFSGEESVGGFLAFLFAAGSLNGPIKKIQQSLVSLPGTAVSIERLMEIIDSDEEVMDHSQEKVPSHWEKVEFKSVGFAYGKEPVLKDISLSVNRGEAVALVGESGSGKTTITHLLERFFEPTSGQILIDNKELKDFSLSDLRRNIALVNQDVFLFHDTVESNIRAGNHDVSLDEVKEAARKANALEFIEALPEGFQTNVGERGGRLSGGQRQRVSIARAILKDAPILILDEATSALDSASEIEVQKGLNTLMKGRTTFVIAHRLSTVSGVDRIYVMEKGEIIEVGNHEELIEKKGRYAHFHSLQS